MDEQRVDRDYLLADAARLEDAQPDPLKSLWLLSGFMADPVSILPRTMEFTVIVEAVTSTGAVATARTLELLPDVGDVRMAGPFPREMWPQSWWYQRLTEADFALLTTKGEDGATEAG